MSTEAATGILTVNEITVDLLKGNQIWADLLEAIDAIFKINVEGPISQLERVRFIAQDSDTELLKTTARMLGFDATEDVLDLNSDTLTRLVSQLPRYPDQNSTYYFVNFIDVLLNSSVSIKYLTTEDYVNFYPEPKGTLIEYGGTWFSTTHISLTIALYTLKGLSLKPGETLLSRALNLFYSYSPIPLVVDRIELATYMDQVDFGLTAKLLPGKKSLIVN